VSRYGKNHNKDEDYSANDLYQDYLKHDIGRGTILLGDSFDKAEQLWFKYVCPNCKNRFKQLQGECSFEKCLAIRKEQEC